MAKRRGSINAFYGIQEAQQEASPPDEDAETADQPSGNVPTADSGEEADVADLGEDARGANVHDGTEAADDVRSAEGDETEESQEAEPGFEVTSRGYNTSDGTEKVRMSIFTTPARRDAIGGMAKMAGMSTSEYVLSLIKDDFEARGLDLPEGHV